MINVKQIPLLSDNYCYLIQDDETGSVAVIDPGDAKPVLDEAKRLNWQITDILLTHHHYDHVDGVAEIKTKTGAIVTGPTKDKHRIEHLDKTVDGGDILTFGSHTAKVFFVPGHTLGHIAFWFEKAGILFPGDSLFALGCGRLFEGTPEMMWQSLQQYLSLPKQTLAYCAHEYTLANADFALTIDPTNKNLIQRVAQIRKLRSEGNPTVPSTLDEEFMTNPFLRPNDPRIREQLKMVSASDAEVFKEIRLRKDNF